jgi:hypothetical protein
VIHLLQFFRQAMKNGDDNWDGMECSTTIHLFPGATEGEEEENGTRRKSADNRPWTRGQLTSVDGRPTFKLLGQQHCCIAGVQFIKMHLDADE